ncbi:FAD-dependent oxidoreductase [uncultured Erythrobacter sp.]|uniref:NAD(P)/FAD-dependent oxidoreductase n=1 Tax=uncultured Erythrobacter sp. TaxID=263913 RepID=UPI00260DFB04|nr:FAD-dependent oxidoreductase [uncultured Erythrobacter sp.]
MAGQETDKVIVIGGGVIGIACAHYLNQAGYAVTVLESGSLAAACSHGNCGYICPSHVLPLTTPGALREGLKSLLNPSASFRIKPRLEPAFIRWLWQFSRRCSARQMLETAKHLNAILESSAAEYRRLLTGEIDGAEYRQSGLLYVFGTAEAAEVFSANERAVSARHGVRSDWIEGADLRDFDGALKPDLAGGVLFPDDASLRPDQLTAQWAALLKGRGVTFREGVRFENVERSGRMISAIKTSAGAMQADHYVLAAGAISGRLAGYFGRAMPIEPGKGYSITLDRPKQTPRVPMLFPEHHVGITPFDSGFRIGSMMEFAGFDSAIPQRRLQQLRRSVAHYLVDDLPKNNIEEWYGWRPMTWDSLPIIGAMPDTDNVCLATGHNMLGMTLAPATGKLVAEHIQGQIAHIDPTPFSPARFN